MGELQLPGPRRAADLGIVSCAADDCSSKGLAQPGLDDRGQVIPQPPAGWGVIEAISGQGDGLVLFVCSPSCERRLARKLAGPRLGSLDG